MTKRSPRPGSAGTRRNRIGQPKARLAKRRAANSVILLRSASAPGDIGNDLPSLKLTTSAT
jgi:hypothetical protein